MYSEGGMYIFTLVAYIGATGDDEYLILPQLGAHCKVRYAYSVKGGTCAALAQMRVEDIREAQSVARGLPACLPAAPKCP